MLRKIIQSKQVIPLMTSLLTAAIVTPSQAANVKLDTMGRIISIEDIQLVEGGVEIPGNDFTFTVTRTYNINFSIGSFIDIFNGENSDLSNLDTSCNLGQSNSLCFWENESQATLLIDQMNATLNNTLNDLNEIPSVIVGTRVNYPPFLDNTTNFYRVPVQSNQSLNTIVSRQGTYDSSLAQPWVTDPLIENSPTAATMYVGATLTSEEFKAEIPESSNLMGIVVTVGLMILVTRKK